MHHFVYYAEKIRQNGVNIMQIDDTDRALLALLQENARLPVATLARRMGLARSTVQARLDRLEDTHRSVIAAAYENLAGTNQVHRAILRMLDPVEFESFLRDLDGEVAHILRVDALRLVLESVQNDNDPAVRRLGDVLSVAEPGFIRGYLTQGRDAPARQVTLRQIDEGDMRVYGRAAPHMRSEACLLLDFGSERLPGMLVMGAEDPHQFSPQQGTDLLAFFAGVFERVMRRWLS